MFRFYRRKKLSNLLGLDLSGDLGSKRLNPPTKEELPLEDYYQFNDRGWQVIY